MKVFIAKYSWYGKYGAFQDYNYVIVAETKNVALGLALETHKETDAQYWEFEEIDPNKQSINWVSERCD